MKKNKIWIIAISLVILFSILGYLAYNIFFKKEAKKDEPNNETNITEINGYGITLTDNDTALYKTEFEMLKANLESGNIDYQEYAKSIAKLYIIDLYTINNKVNKYEVGGVEFVYEGAKDNYVTNVTDTLYKYVEDNSKNKRKQELPVVSSINVDSINEVTYKVNDENITYNGYKIKVTWDYEKDLGYDKTAEIIIINKDNHLYVVEENTK